jgi:hypothetical protein
MVLPVSEIADVPLPVNRCRPSFLGTHYGIVQAYRKEH